MTKWTYNMNQSQKLIGYYQYTNKRQPDYLFGSTTILKSDALQDSYFPVRVVKGEYNASIGQSMYFELRAGAYISDFTTKSKSQAPRIEDSGANTASGGVAGGKLTRSRPQANGSLSYFKQGWGGNHAAGFQVLMHATSPRAQDMALDAIEAALKDAPRPDARPRIEHLGGTLDEPRLARAKQLGAIIVPTPGGIQGGGAGGRAASGPARNPYRSLLEIGFRPPGNSDTAGTRTDMINPMRNVYLLVTRVNNRGIVSHPDEALSVMDALRVYTTFSAYASFEEQIKGTIEPGKLADLVVLSDDPLTIPPARLKDVKVDATIIDGKIAYQRSGGPVQ